MKQHNIRGRFYAQERHGRDREPISVGAGDVNQKRGQVLHRDHHISVEWNVLGYEMGSREGKRYFGGRGYRTANHAKGKG